jgi:hypothetical protein
MIKVYELQDNGKIIAQVIQFHDGSAVLKYLNDDDSSVVVYRTMGDLLKVHERGDRKIIDKIFIF